LAQTLLSYWGVILTVRVERQSVSVRTMYTAPVPPHAATASTLLRR